MRPIVFLDVDGVLNHPGCGKVFHAAMAELTVEQAKAGYETDVHVDKLFDQRCVARLNQITDAVGADIVLSSSWRMWYWNKRDRFRDLARRVGITAPVVDFTPRRGTGGLQRGDEIVTWLTAHRQEVRIVVLDDDSDMDAVEPWFVHTSGWLGLQPRDVEAAIKILRGEPWRRR